MACGDVVLCFVISTPLFVKPTPRVRALQPMSYNTRYKSRRIINMKGNFALCSSLRGNFALCSSRARWRRKRQQSNVARSLPRLVFARPRNKQPAANHDSGGHRQLCTGPAVSTERAAHLSKLPRLSAKNVAAALVYDNRTTVTWQRPGRSTCTVFAGYV